MTKTVRLCPDTYADSVTQLSGTRAMYVVDGVEWATAAMATPANVSTLADEGFDISDLDSAGANDLFLAVRAGNEAAANAALDAAQTAMFGSRPAAADEGAAPVPRTLRGALDQQPGTNVAVISVPGDYATLEAHKALSAGMHVLLFSDNVSVEDEIELKDRARSLGRFMMGPGAGTAMLGGVGLGFANVIKPGRVAVVAAAGTGAQEAMCLLDRWGDGAACVIGLGGRDLTAKIDGRMARLAVQSLARREDIDAILLASKPPADDVARALVAAAGDKPFVGAYVGTTASFDLPSTARVAATLEAGVLETLRLLGRDVPDVVGDLDVQVAKAIDRLGDDRTLVRGLYSGGTLCYEALTILGDILGPVYSNSPLDKELTVPAPEGSHICLDLGEEEYTRGRPHPMIDPQARVDLLREQGTETDVAAILLDVVIGRGSHADPAGHLAPICEEIHRNGGPQVVAYVLGTAQDPQDFQRQRHTLEAAGCIVTETAARAALAAAALATRDPQLTRREL
jgi:FdrA protein